MKKSGQTKTAARILIVDDQPANICILQEILSEDYLLHAVYSGQEALEVLDSFQPDVVLLDIMMPHMDGYEVCRHIRAKKRHQLVKIIMVSAKAMVEERIEGYRAGADDYLTKPFDEDELLAKISVFLRLSSLEEVDQFRSDLLRVLSNSDNTIIESILEPAKVLIDKKNMALDLRKNLGAVICRNAEFLEEYITAALDLCALDTGRVTLDQAELSEVVHSAVKVAQAQGDKSCSAVEVRIASSPLELTVDAEKLETALGTLIAQAAELSPAEQKVGVDIDQDASNASVIISVAATLGPDACRWCDPFADEDHEGENIVDSFRRLRRAHASRFIQNLGGRVDIESHEERAKVTVHIPLVGAECVQR